MKRTGRSLLKSYFALRFFLDDLREIENILKRYRGYKIEAPGYEYESIAELRDTLAPKPITLDFSCYDPHISLELRGYGAQLYVADVEESGASAFNKLERIIKRARRKPNFLYSFYAILLAVPLLSGSLLTLSHQAVSRPWNIAILTVCAATALYVWWVWIIRTFYGCPIILEERSTRKSFISRNFDQMAVGSISALIGAIVGAAVTIWAQQHFGK